MNSAVQSRVMRFMPFSVPQSWPGNNPSPAAAPWGSVVESSQLPSVLVGLRRDKPAFAAGNLASPLATVGQITKCRQKVHPFFLVVVTLYFQLLRD
jgi:hypothetical protein